MTYNPRVLEDVLRARALTVSGLAKRLEIDTTKLREELNRSAGPPSGLIKSIAKELAVPHFVFYMINTPPLQEALVDYRSESPNSTPKSKETIRAIQLAKSIQNTALEFKLGGASDLPYFSFHPSAQAVERARTSREYFGITLEDQLTSKDAAQFYNVCRKRLEDKGIFVIQASFPAEDGSGICLANPTHPVIVINTKDQNRGRRLFTLIHELCHVLTRRSGISDPFVRKNGLESFCNRFAACFLVPLEYTGRLLGEYTPPLNPTREDVATAATLLKVSQQAAVLRLEQLRIFPPGSHGKWLKIVRQAGNPDFADKPFKSKTPTPQAKIKFARYGSHFSRVFSQLLKREDLGEIELYRRTGLKPSYQQELFDYFRSINMDDIRSSDVDDD